MSSKCGVEAVLAYRYSSDPSVATAQLERVERLRPLFREMELHRVKDLPYRPKICHPEPTNEDSNKPNQQLEPLNGPDQNDFPGSYSAGGDHSGDASSQEDKTVHAITGL